MTYGSITIAFSFPSSTSPVPFVQAAAASATGAIRPDGLFTGMETHRLVDTIYVAGSRTRPTVPRWKTRPQRQARSQYDPSPMPKSRKALVPLAQIRFEVLPLRLKNLYTQASSQAHIQWRAAPDHSPNDQSWCTRDERWSRILLLYKCKQRPTPPKQHTHRAPKNEEEESGQSGKGCRSGA